MPVSSTEGKAWLTARVVAHNPKTILDVGVGAGVYEEILRPLLPGARFVGVEVFEPYVARYRLAERYDEMVVADVMDIDPLPTADIVILGDVLEHLVQPDALTLWDRARAAARQAVMLSLPIVEYPQGPVYGNEHEAHRHTWCHDDVIALPGVFVDWFSLPWPRTIGAYEVKGEA